VIFGTSLSEIFKYALIGALISQAAGTLWGTVGWIAAFLVVDCILQVIDERWDRP
jgi:hypothetical protein